MNRGPGRRGWIRLIPAAIVFSVLAFFAGMLVVGARRPEAVHPLTGRHIAGIATDAQWMDRGPREEEEQPDRALDLIGVAPGSVVADVGAGSGYMTVRLAQRVGAAGRVYAEDIQPGLLAMVADKARQAKLSNIELTVGTGDDARLPHDVLDLAVLVDVYHEFSQPQKMLQSLRRALKPGGRLVLVEYRLEDPTIPIADTHRMSVANARSEVEAEAFTFDQTIEALPRQHVIVFRRPPGD